MSGRSRGRPTGGEAGETRARLITAAREQFAARGFAGTSLRSVAREAGVDPSLISHYFGGRHGLLVATLDLPIDAMERITGVLTEGPDGLGERLVRTFVSSWDPHRDTISGLLRSIFEPDGVQGPVFQFVRTVLVDGLTEVLDGDAVRADLVMAQVIGLGSARYVLEVDPLREAPIEDVVALYGPAIQAVVDAESPRS